MYDENITLPTTSDYRLNPQLSYYGTKAKVKVDGSCLKQDKVTFNHEKVVNIYIVSLSLAVMTIILHYKMHCLVQLTWLKMLKLIDMNIQVMELDLIKDQGLNIQAVKMVKM